MEQANYTNVKDLNMSTKIDAALLNRTYWYEPENFSTWWPQSGITSFQYDSFKHAFKVAKVLIEKELVKDMTIGSFLTLVADIEREL